MKSLKGRVVDFAALLSQNETMPAVGNAGLNARGDKIDKYNKIVATNEEINAAYFRSEQAVKKVSLRDLSSEILPTPQEAVKEMRDNVKKTNRNIVDSDK